MGRSLILWIYLGTIGRADRCADRQLAKRLAAGKEDAERLGERHGEAGLPRPIGQLVWFHAASVGEVLSLLELIRRIGEERPDISFLLTSGTVTSAEVLSARMPPRTQHQYVPIDTQAAVARFLDHWRPDVAVWTESEFWPTLMVKTHGRGIPMLLVNARITVRSYRGWRLMGGAAKSLLARFDHVLAQDEAGARRLRRLGLAKDRVEVTGTLKEGSPAPACDEVEHARLIARLDGRPVWLAASTHPGEEEVVLAAHRIAGRAALGLLLILVPRHPERGDAVAEMVKAAGLTLARRSNGEDPRADTQVYLADTMGEMGLWYRIAPVSFIGGSLVPVGGHNPFEPAALGSAILTGPQVTNFADIFERLAKAGAAVTIRDGQSLAEGVGAALAPDRAATMAAAAWEVTSAGADVTDRAIALITEALDRGAAR